MKDGKYEVNRDDIYVGEVVESTSFYPDYDDDSKLSIGSCYHIRSMLFVLDDDGSANDLLYTSEQYPVLNITEANIVQWLGRHSTPKRPLFVVDHAYNIGELLKYYGFGETMTSADVVRARNFLFAKKFMENHCEDFGFRLTELGFVSDDTKCQFFGAFNPIADRADGHLDNGRWAFTPKFEEGPVRRIKPRKAKKPTKR